MHIAFRLGILAYVLGLPCLAAIRNVSSSKVASLVVVAVVLALSLLAIAFWSFSRNRSGTRLLTWYLAFIAVMALATIISTIGRYTNESMFQWQTLFLMFLWTSGILVIPAVVTSAQDLRFASRILDVTGILIAVSVFLPILGVPIGEVQESAADVPRVFGALGDQVGFILVLFAARSLVGNRWPTFLFYVTAVLITGTRGALLVLVVTLLAQVVLLRNTLRSSRPSGTALVSYGAMTIGVALVITVTLLLLSFSFISDRILSVETIQWTAGYRMASLSIALEVFLSNPLIGVGYYGFRSSAWSHNPSLFFDYFDENYVATVPNQYVQTATDGGLIGLLVLLALFWAVVRQLVDAARESSGREVEFCGLTAWVIGLLIGNQSAAWLLPYSIIGHLFFVIAGLAIAERRIRGRTTNGPSEPLPIVRKSTSL